MKEGIILGLGYQKQVGKDTVADYLVDNWGFKKLSFASPLKELCRNIVECADGKLLFNDYLLLQQHWALRYNAAHQEYSHIFQEIETLLRLRKTEESQVMLALENGKPRKLLQWLGTDMFRAVDEDFWVQALQSEIDRMPAEVSLVISDMRFKNEMGLVKHFGHAVWIRRETVADPHPSENDLKGEKFNYIISNNKDIGYLYAQIDDMLYDIGEIDA